MNPPTTLKTEVNSLKLMVERFHNRIIELTDEIRKLKHHHENDRTIEYHREMENYALARKLSVYEKLFKTEQWKETINHDQKS